MPLRHKFAPHTHARAQTEHWAMPRAQWSLKTLSHSSTLIIFAIILGSARYVNANVCTCSNGVAATGNACTVNNSNNCTSCDLGYRLNNSSCHECPAGTSAGVGSTQCTPCNNGTYQDRPGQSSCKPHIVCDPNLQSGASRGVPDISSSSINPGNCTAVDCTKLIAEHTLRCTGTKCNANAMAIKSCTSIRKLYKTSPMNCPCPATTRL